MIGGNIDYSAVFVFTDGKGGWSQTAILSPGNQQIGDGFGSSVALTGSAAVVGAPNVDAVYMFTKTPDDWKQT